MLTKLDTAKLCTPIQLGRRFTQPATDLMDPSAVKEGSAGACAVKELSYDDKRRMVLAVGPDGRPHLIPISNVAEMVPHEDAPA
ncbi:MAG: hypothetical protein WC683_09420 [bacterium]|jgi:hypothetical protein